MSRVDCTARTEGQTKINKIVWTIPNFIGILNSRNVRVLRFDKLKAESDPDTKFSLKMLFLGSDNDLIEIYYLSHTTVFLKAIFAFDRFMGNVENGESNMVIQEYRTQSANKWKHLYSFLKRDIVQRRDHFLKSNGTMLLTFQFLLTNNINVNLTVISETQLSKDLENLLNNELFADIIIQSSDCVEFKAHKAVLASRSVVLRAIFETNMKESQTNIVESPLDVDVLKEVLTYIYSAKSPKVDEIPEKLLAAADHYQLSGLKTLCEEALHERLTVENAIDILELADLHSAKGLKHSTLEFIKDGEARLITKTEGWKNVKSVDLIKCIYEHIMNDDTDTDLK